MNLLRKLLTGKESIKEQLMEKRPLPIGLTEFHEWSERIISGAMLPADVDSQKFALANEIMHCGPNVAFEQDAYFIHRLRKYAANQVADEVRKSLYETKKQQAEVTPPTAECAKT